MMNRILLYTIVGAIVVFWAIGFFIYTVGAIIHVLLIAAFIALLLRKREKGIRLENEHRKSVTKNESIK